MLSVHIKPIWQETLQAQQEETQKAVGKQQDSSNSATSLTIQREKNTAFRLPNGTKTRTDKENIQVMQPHCIRILNNHKIVSPKALEFAVQRERYKKLDNPMTWGELTKAVDGLKNNKAPGSNGVTGEAFKAMDTNNIQKVFNFIVAYWDGETEYES